MQTFNSSAKLLVISVLFIFLFTLNSLAQDRNWTTFTPPDGAFSILSPGKMETDADARNNPEKRGTYTYADLFGFFAVGYRQLPKMPPDVKAYYVKTRDGAVAGVKGKLVKEEDFTNGGMTGWDLHIKTENGMERARMFFHANRFYVIIASSSEEEVDSDEFNNYFNSFVPGDIDITKKK